MACCGLKPSHVTRKIKHHLDDHPVTFLGWSTKLLFLARSHGLFPLLLVGQLGGISILQVQFNDGLEGETHQLFKSSRVAVQKYSGSIWTAGAAGGWVNDLTYPYSMSSFSGSIRITACQVVLSHWFFSMASSRFWDPAGATSKPRNFGDPNANYKLGNLMEVNAQLRAVFVACCGRLVRLQKMLYNCGWVIVYIVWFSRMTIVLAPLFVVLC